MNSENSVRQESDQRRESFAAFLLNRDAVLREREAEVMVMKPSEDSKPETVAQAGGGMR